MTSRQKITLAALVLLSLGLGSINLTKPFLHHAEGSLTQVGKLARNYHKFGYGTLGFGVLDASGPDLKAYDDYRKYFYTGHPPMTYWLASLTMRLAPGEAGVRLLPILFMAAATAIFYLIALRKLEEPWAAVAGFVFAANPMMAYNSVATVHLIVVLCFALAGVLQYLRWRKSGRRRDFLLLLGIQVVACWTDWQGYYLAPLVLVHLWATDRPRWKWGAAMVGLNFVLFGSFVLFVLSLAPEGGASMSHFLALGGERAGLSFSSVPGYLLGEAREIGLYFTVPVALLAAVGLIRGRDPFLACLLFLGLDELLFIKYTMVHDYFTFCMTPFFALGAAMGAKGLAQSLPRTPRIAILSLALIAFVGQSAVVLSNRLTRQGGYEFYYRLAGALNAVTRPEEKLVILTSDIRFYTPYYADRYMIWVNRKDGELLVENSGGRRKPFGPADLEPFLKENREGFRYAVTADREGIRKSVRFLSTQPDAILREFGAHDDDREFLGKLCGAPLEKDGFLFWKLPGR